MKARTIDVINGNTDILNESVEGGEQHIRPVIEDFDSGHWTAANEFKGKMDLATLRTFTQHFDEPIPLSPWQERFLMEYSKADVAATRHMHLPRPRRNSGRAYFEWMQSQFDTYFQDTYIINMEEPVPTNVQAQESRRRPVQPQNNYPTSSNPTQERRRRNH